MTDLLVAAFVALLVLGGMHIPRLGDAVGRALRNRRALQSPGSGGAANGQ
jgi:Sec-independent protein translocase protein TatA